MDVKMWFSLCFIPYNIADAASVHGKVLFANYTSIMEINVDSQNVTVLVEHGDSNVYSLDYDYQHRYVYFPRFYSKDIVRFQYFSHSIVLQHVVNTSYNPVGVSVDSANDHLYWVNQNSANTLTRCKLDGTNVFVVSTSLSHTFMIRLDVINRWMYIGYNNNGISKSRFDLTDMSIIANFTTHSYCMDIDLNGKNLMLRVYFVNGDDGIKIFATVDCAI